MPKTQHIIAYSKAFGRYWKFFLSYFTHCGEIPNNGERSPSRKPFSVK